MNDWIGLRPEDLEIHMQGAQLRALRETVLGPNERDPLPELLAGVTAQVRSAVASARGALLSRDLGKIPSELRDDACALVLERLQSRIPALRLTADQVRAADNARRQLRNVADGKVALVRPSDPAFHLAESRTAMVCIHGRRRRVGAPSLEGL
jgi:hypothetical protein